MADMSRTDRTDRPDSTGRSDRADRPTRTDRAQLILVGGVVVAFALVALVLLLNTALFAENVATRGLGPGPDRAADHAAFADRATERVLRQEERVEYVSWADAEANATDGLRRIGAAVRTREFSEHGAVATMEPDAVRPGAALVQNDTGGFRSAGGTANWTLADSTGGIRNYTMTVDADGTSSPANATDAFTVRIEGGSEVWEAYVYASGSGTVIVNVTGETCESDSSVATVDWTRGTLDGCTFPFATDGSGRALSGPYDVAYLNGDEAEGTYHLVVRNRTTDDVETQHFGDPGTATLPRSYHTVYAVRLAVGYEGSSVDYDTHVRAAPGEPENTSPAS
jgi:hypothetical protein